MLPSDIRAFDPYPSVRRFIDDHLSMQFDDVRAMIKLPLAKEGLPAGCNFAAAAMLSNLISGISVVLYAPKNKRAGSGAKFKELLVECYPWEAGENKADKAKVIYDLVRNPLAHALGVLKKGSVPLAIEKGPLTEAQLAEIENATTRPASVPQAVRKEGARYVLSVAGLYWGVFQMLRGLASNAKQMQQAEKRLASGKV